MKTYSSLSLVAAIVAFIAFPISLELAGSMLLVIGLGCMFLGDYARQPKLSHRIAAPVVTLPAQATRFSPVFELAA